MTAGTPGQADGEAQAAAYGNRLRAVLDAIGPPRGAFKGRFTVLPDSGVIELHCSSHAPEAVTWKVGYHPSLDVLVEQAAGHSAAQHGDGPAPEPKPASEAAELRAVIDMIWRMCQQPDAGRLAERVAGLIKNSGMEPF